MGIQHLLMIKDYNLDSYNCQHIAGSPQLSVGSRTDNQELLDHGIIALRHQKFNDWFFRQFDLDILNADGQHYRRSTIIVNNLHQAIKIFFQLSTSSEGANIFKLSILSLHRTSNNVFGMSNCNYINQESVAKHEQQLIDFNAFHFSSTLSMQLFNEGSKHLDHHREKHSMATIRANTDNIS